MKTRKDMDRMIIMKRYIAKIIFIVIFFSCIVAPKTPAVSAATQANAIAKINSAEGAYLRKGPSTSTQKLALMKNKTKITIVREYFVTTNNTGIKYRWYYIKVGKKSGYVRADLVKNIRYTNRNAWTKDELNFRQGAGTSMKLKGTYKKGAQIRVVLESRAYKSDKVWYRIKDGNNYYYVSGEWLTFSKPKGALSTASKVSTKSSSSTVAQSAASKKVAEGAVSWAIRIANDNSFHYGNGQHAHHNGCYYCGTQPYSKQRYVVGWKKTYCCNPFVHAAYAHGGKEATMLRWCKKGRSYDWDYLKTHDNLFAKLGHPSKSSLIKGDILCYDGHMAMYIGDGKLVEAGFEDDGKKNSISWNNSISISTLTDRRYKGFTHAYRYIGKN